MTAHTRNHLPARRFHETFSFSHWNVTYNVGLGRYPDGRLGEVFINADKKVGTNSDVMARDSAVLLSLALQFGVPISNLRHAVTRDPNGEASGPIGRLLDMLHEEEAALERATGSLG
jgi:hypothetical protein